MLEERASASSLANRGAHVIQDAHLAYRAGFAAITKRAGHRFTARLWRELKDDADQRIDLYGDEVSTTVAKLETALAPRVSDRIVWAALKAVFSNLIAGSPERDVAETFFNSVARRVFDNVGVDRDIEFVHADADLGPVPASSVTSTFEGPVVDQVGAILASLPFQSLLEDPPRDASRVAERIQRAGGGDTIEIALQPFYREQGAYVVGRVTGGTRPIPLVLCLRHGDAGVVVDAVLTERSAISVLFGFTRSHFLVDLGPPRELVRFLRSLLPTKRTAELYVAIGEYKHGKTELYRDLIDRLDTSSKLFRVTPGQPGLVMEVFGLDGYDLVFKVIRDRFSPPKTVTRSRVMDRYRFVFHNDRAGRLVEAHEFEHLSIPSRRFHPDLLESMLESAGRTVRLSGSDVVIDHAYVERRVEPLDVFLETRSLAEGEEAVRDYAQAIEDLAHTDVFCGDILPKNFGLTSSGRVVFYDYDDLDLVTNQRFRPVPISDDPLDEMSAEPWYGHGPNDAFPSEWIGMLGFRQQHRSLLETEYGHLFSHRFWNEVQAHIKHSEPHEVLPYGPDHRLAPSNGITR